MFRLVVISVNIHESDGEVGSTIFVFVWYFFPVLVVWLLYLFDFVFFVVERWLKVWRRVLVFLLDESPLIC